IPDTAWRKDCGLLPETGTGNSKNAEWYGCCFPAACPPAGLSQCVPRPRRCSNVVQTGELNTDIAIYLLQTSRLATVHRAKATIWTFVLQRIYHDICGRTK